MLAHCSSAPESSARRCGASLLHALVKHTQAQKSLACTAALQQLPRFKRQEVEGFIAASHHHSLQPDTTPQTKVINKHRA